MQADLGSALSAGIGRFLDSLSSSLPSILAFAAVLALGALLAFAVGRATEVIAGNAAVPNPKFAGRVGRYAVLVLVALVALDRLGLGRSILGLALIMIAGAAVLALAIAFGLGAARLARRQAERREKD